MKLKTYGKINLFLDVKGKEKNNYHLIKTVMQSVNIYDEISLNPLAENKIIIECSDVSVPSDENNTCYKAAQLMKETYNIDLGIHIFINKNIPAQAGLAGGSANAAGVIRGLNKMWNLNLSIEEMCHLASQIGSDVAFCLLGGTYLAEGTGEKLTKLNAFKWDHILIIKPEFSMSTKFVYDNVKTDYYNSYLSNNIIKHIRSNDYEKTALCLSNTLEKVVEKFHPEISDIEKLMLDNHALSSIMTGAGSAVFALFKDSESLNKAYETASKLYPHTFIARTVECGVKLEV